MARVTRTKPISRSTMIHPDDLYWDQGANEAALDIVWTANEPAAGDAQVIADGDAPTVAELGQAVANLTAKLNAALEILKDNGLMVAD